VTVALDVWLTIAASLAIAAWLTGVVRKLAVSHGVLDVPNARSSHQRPTPRGGGVAIAVATTVGWLVLAFAHAVSFDLAMALLGGGAAVALVGYLDDRRRLSVWVRLIVHFGAAVWALAWLGGVPPLRVGERLVALGYVGDVLATLAVVWTLNLFNFMDGIDGIAASEGVFIASAGAVLSLMLAEPHGVAAPALVFSAACCGFLIWNWPPAKIFMGDVGSGFVGYVIAVLTLGAARESATALPVWLLLGGVFFVDASVTLARRLARHEPVYEAHRQHAYQHLARRWGGHRPVTVAVIVVDLLWLLPCAVVATRAPRDALSILLLGLAPLLVVAVVAGAGSRERSS
jgi:Fuc2NAc and GlcNAc transferase